MSTTDYKKLAEKAREAIAKPLGDMDADVAVVLLTALQSQDLPTLRLVKADYPTQWSKYYTKGKDGKHYWNKEGYNALKKLAEIDDLSGDTEL